MSFLSLPDGSYLQLRPGESPAQGRLRAMQAYPEAFNLGKPEQPQAPSGVSPALKYGVQNFAGNVATTVLGAFDPQLAGQAALADAKQPPSANITSFQDVQDAFGQGTMSGIGTLGAFARDQVASNLPNMAAALAGAKLGAMGGAAVAPALGPLAPVAPLLGGAAGAFLPSFASQAGSNIQRQAVEQDKAGQPLDISRGAAFGAAVPQAALDAASTFMLLGKIGVAKLGGKPVQEAMKAAGANADEVLKQAAQRSIAANLGRGFGRGAVAEMPTEIAQQVLERAQAGRPLTGEDANREYTEIAAAAGIVGGLMGGGANVMSRSAGKQLLREDAAAKTVEQEKALKDQLGAERNQLLAQPAPFTELESAAVPGYTDRTVTEVPDAPPRPKDEYGVVGPFFTGDTSKKQEALRTRVAGEDSASLYGGYFADPTTRDRISRELGMPAEVERLQLEEAAAREADEKAKAEGYSEADAEMQRRRENDRSAKYGMFNLPGIRQDDGEHNAAYVQRLITEIRNGQADEAIATALKLPLKNRKGVTGFLSLDPLARNEAVAARLAEIETFLRTNNNASRKNVATQAAWAQRALAKQYLENVEAAATRPAGGPSFTEQTEPELPYTSGSSPQVQGIERLREAANNKFEGERAAPPVVTPPPAPQEQGSLLTRKPRSVTDRLEGEDIAPLRKQIAAQEKILSVDPDDVEAQDALEKVSSPFQQAVQRKLRLQALGELSSVLDAQSNVNKDGGFNTGATTLYDNERQALLNAYDILSKPETNKTLEEVRAKEKLADVVGEQLHRIRTGRPVDLQAMNQALRPLAKAPAPDTKTLDLFSGLNAEDDASIAANKEVLRKRAEQGRAKKRSLAEQRRAEAEYNETLKATRKALLDAQRDAANAVKKARDTQEKVLFPLEAKIQALLGTLNKLARAKANNARALAALTDNRAVENAENEGMRVNAEPDVKRRRKKAEPDTTTEDIARSESEGMVDPELRQRSLPERKPLPFDIGVAENEGMLGAPPPPTVKYDNSLYAQVQRSLQQFERTLTTLDADLKRRIERTQSELDTRRKELEAAKAATPARRILTKQWEDRTAQLNKIRASAVELRKQKALLGRRNEIAPVPYTASAQPKAAGAQPPPIPGTVESVRVENTAVPTPFKTPNGDVVQQKRRVIRPGENTWDTPWAAPLAWGKKAEAEGQRGQTQDPFSTPKAEESSARNSNSPFRDVKQTLYNAWYAATGTPNPGLSEGHEAALNAAQSILRNPAQVKALGMSPLHAKLLDTYLSKLSGLTSDSPEQTVRVRFVDSFDGAPNATGRYDPETNTILLRKDTSIQVFAHEMAHAATLSRFARIKEAWNSVAREFGFDRDLVEGTDPNGLVYVADQLRKDDRYKAFGIQDNELTALRNIGLAMAQGARRMQAARSEGQKVNIYGMTDLPEFLAEWFTNPSFAQFISDAAKGQKLADMDTTGMSSFRSGLQKLANMVKKFIAEFLGLEGEARTAFDRISDSVSMFHNAANRIAKDADVKVYEHRDMSHVEPGVAQLSNVIQSKGAPFWRTVMKANLTGLGFRVNFLDQGAAWEEFLARASKGGLVDAARQIHAQWAYRQANLTSHYMNAVLADKEAFFGARGLMDLRDSNNTAMGVAKKLAEAGVPQGETTYQLYKIAKRAKRVGIDRLKRALKNDEFDREWTQARVDEAARLDEQYPVFREIDAMENTRNNALLDLLVQSGRMDKDEAARLKSFGDYVPFYRVEEDGSLYLIHDDTTEMSIGKIDDPQELAALKGSSLKIKPYFENAITNTRYILNSALRNNALRESVAMFEDMKLGHHVGSKTSSTRTLTYYKDGQEKFFELDQELTGANKAFEGLPSELLAEAFMGSRYALPSALKIMQGPARLLRYMVTRNPLYAARQILREPLTSNFTAGNDTVPLVGAVQALIGSKQSYKDAHKVLQRYGVVGGQVLTGTSEDVRTVLQNLTQGKTTFGKAMAALDKLAMEADMATRLTQYDSAIKQGLSEPEAALIALESMNFTRHGALPAVQIASMLVPFLNAQLQGLDVLYRAARGKMAFNDRLDIKNKFMKRALMMTALSMIYASAMQDEEPWKSASEQERDMNWFVPVPGVEGAWIKVPINFEVGYLFKALPERMVALMNGDDQATSVMKALGTMASQTIPNPIPQALKPLIEWWTNYSFFTGRPVQTQRMLNLDPSQRFTERTSAVAKEAGQALEFELPSGQKIGLSPAAIEHLVRGYTSQLGMVVMQTAGAALESMNGGGATGRPTRELHETPLFGPMLANTKGFGPTNRFYEIKTELDRRANTIRELTVQDPEKARLYAREYAKDAGLARHANQVSARLNQLRSAQAKVWYSDADPDEKRDRIRSLRLAEIELVTRFNNAYQEARP